MPRIRFRYSLGRVRGSSYAPDGYDVALELSDPDGTFVERAVHSGVKPLASREFRLVLSTREMGDSHCRLRITRPNQPESVCYSRQRRLALKPSQRSKPLGHHRFLDNAWSIKGAIVCEPGIVPDPTRLNVLVEVRSGPTCEEPVTLNPTAEGAFEFKGPRMFLDPVKKYEVLIRVLDEAGVEIGRYYREAVAKTPIDVRIRAGQPFLDVWSAFRSRHPQLVERLERFDYDPKRAHRSIDAWYIFRRFDKINTYQIAEGVVAKAKKGPTGDPDWVWDIRLDPFYDSPEGFQLPNDKNRVKHQGLHVEACNSLNRKALPKDGLKADATTVPLGQRVWMLGTHVFDDAWDFGSPDHEHFELHPLYVMEPCLGGWYHFAVFESIALTPEIDKIGETPPRDAWPWKSAEPSDYEAAYVKLNPLRCQQELAASYTMIYDRYRNAGDDDGLVRFFVNTSLRYDLFGVDSGLPGMPAGRDYSAWARERIEEGRRAPIREAIINRLKAMHDFLYGRPSYALDPVRGPAPQSFLRCVYAMENAHAAKATKGRVGVDNPRISVNRAAARQLLALRRELSQLYADLFAEVSNPTARARLFADAIGRYHDWAVIPNSATKDMMRAELIRFATENDNDRLTRELRAHVNRFWRLLTPFRNR